MKIGKEQVINIIATALDGADGDPAEALASLASAIVTIIHRTPGYQPSDRDGLVKVIQRSLADPHGALPVTLERRKRQ